jgi:hypothetical protein
MLPECALPGTVTTRPSFELCRCPLGEPRAIRAPRTRGKATACPLFNPWPCNSSVPCVETWCCFVPQLLAGTQCAAVILTVVLEFAACLWGLPVKVPPVGPLPPLGLWATGLADWPPELPGAPLGGDVPPETAVDANVLAAPASSSARVRTLSSTNAAAVAVGCNRLL